LIKYENRSTSEKEIWQKNFLEKAYNVHGDLYDYSKSQYILSRLKLEIICKVHGSFFMSPNNHLCGKGCPKCKWTKMTNTINEKNTIDPDRLKKINNKTKQTSLQKYGVENYQSLEIVKAKVKQTNLEKYNVEHTAQVEEFKNKKYITCIKKYGVPISLQSDLVKQKAKQTIIKKYGVDNVAKSEEIKLKICKTNLEKYGHECCLGNENIIIKKIKTTIQKYGCYPTLILPEYLNHKPLIKVNLSEEETNIRLKKYLQKRDQLKDISFLQECLEKFDNNINKVSELLNIPSRSILDALKYNKTKNQLNTIRKKTHSIICINWLEEIMEAEGIFIQHGENLGEYRIPGTFLKADGYCEQTNTIYEFYGDYYHGNPKIFKSADLCIGKKTAQELYEKTVQRELVIKSKGFKLKTIWERDYLLQKIEKKEKLND
jgi:hypothetical protein